MKILFPRSLTSLVTLCLLLGVFVLPHHPVYAQWVTSLTPCDQNGALITGLDANGNGYHGQMTDGVLTGSGTGSQSDPANQTYGYVYSPSPYAWERQGGTTTYSWQEDDGGSAGFGTDAGSRLYNPNSDNPFHTTSNGSVNVQLSLAAHYLWQATWNGTGAPTTAPPTPPASEPFLLQTQLTADALDGYGGNGWGSVSNSDYVGLSASVSISDMFGEGLAIAAPAAPDPNSGGYNYQKVQQSGGTAHMVHGLLQMVNGKAIYTITLTGSGQSSSVASVGTYGLDGNASAGASLDGIVKHIEVHLVQPNPSGNPTMGDGANQYAYDSTTQQYDAGTGTITQNGILAIPVTSTIDGAAPTDFNTLVSQMDWKVLPDVVGYIPYTSKGTFGNKVYPRNDEVDSDGASLYPDEHLIFWDCHPQTQTLGYTR